MNWLSAFPDEKKLLTAYGSMEVHDVNAHIHTPYSFSAFTDIAQAFSLAKSENLAALGINDFFVTDGYADFYNHALHSRIFPLFNIEFMGLLKEEQQSGIRINDPNNPGRCYFCGKGLTFPFKVDSTSMTRLKTVTDMSQEQIKTMIGKVNALAQSLQLDIRLDYAHIRAAYAKNLVRERHIAKALRIAVNELENSPVKKMGIYTRLFGGKSPKSALNDHPALENEIRGALLKSGGAAFVEEDEKAFMGIPEIIGIIESAGGIPCYPVLLDDKNGAFTEFEQSPEKLLQHLNALKVSCIEFIPGRNDGAILEKYIGFFNDKGFVILLGTEHNSPDMAPLTPVTRGNTALTPFLRNISYRGCCVVAAHQYRVAKGNEGYAGNRGKEAVDYFARLGNAVIQHHKHFIH